MADLITIVRLKVGLLNVLYQKEIILKREIVNSNKLRLIDLKIQQIKAEYRTKKPSYPRHRRNII